MDINEPTPEALQRKLYFLLEQLQEMARELPPYVNFYRNFYSIRK